MKIAGKQGHIRAESLYFDIARRQMNSPRPAFKKEEEKKFFQKIMRMIFTKLSFVKSTGVKIFVLSLIVGLNLFGLAAIGRTLAVFNDEETSQNIVAAGVLDISVINGTDFTPAATPTQESERNVALSNEGGQDFVYAIRVDAATGFLCGFLELKDNVGAVFSPLSAFISTSTTFSVNPGLLLSARLTSGAPSLENQTCDFKLIVDAWQENLSFGRGFYDIEEIGVSISSGVWIVEPPPDTSVLQPGDVVINEIMWMGSERDNGDKEINDEWIELRNTTDHEIDIGQWKIVNIGRSESDIHIPASKSIPAGGYFMISNWPANNANSLLNQSAVSVDEVNGSVELMNNYGINGRIILKTHDDLVVDSTPEPSGDNWTAGINDNGNNKKWSMERNLSPGDGALVGSWHTCDRSVMSDSDLAIMKSYWDSGAQNYNCGTPGHVNLSKNDPTAVDYESPSMTSNKGLSSGEILGEQITESEGAATKQADEGGVVSDEPAMLEPELVAEPESEAEIMVEDQNGGNGSASDNAAGGDGGQAPIDSVIAAGKDL